jgi:hypothetical protein
MAAVRIGRGDAGVGWTSSFMYLPTGRLSNALASGSSRRRDHRAQVREELDPSRW